MLRHKLFRTAMAALLILSILFVIPTGARAEKDSPDFTSFVNEIDDLIKKHWPLMDELWPGADYTKHNLLLLHIDDELSIQEAWLLGTEEKRQLSESEYENIPAPQPGGFTDMSFEDKQSIAISVDDQDIARQGEAKDIYKTATHELVHFYHQSDQPWDQEGSSRAQIYPIDVTPRLYRQMIFQNMIRAFEKPEQQDDYLGKAKYWQEKWHNEYPDERKAIHSTDIAEGTARYMEYMGALIGDAPAGSERDKLAAEAIMRDDIFASADGESYELGYVAGLLLDRVKPNWKDDFYASNKTLDEMLLEDVEAVSEPMDEEIQQRVTNELETINEEVGEELSNIEKAQKDSSIPWLKIDTTDTSGSFMATGNYQFGDDDVLTTFTSQYRAGDGSINLRGISVASWYTMERDFLMVPLTMVHTLENGVLNVESEQLEVKNVAITKGEEEGRIMYSVTANDQ